MMALLAGALVIFMMGRLHIVGFNPMTMRYAAKQAELSLEFGNIHLVALLGTCIPSAEGGGRGFLVTK